MQKSAGALFFLAGGISAIFSSKILTPPYKYIALVLGIISVAFLLVGVLLPYLITPILGRGGTERWVAYPMVLWLTGFGGYLMAGNQIKTKRNKLFIYFPFDFHLHATSPAANKNPIPISL